MREQDGDGDGIQALDGGGTGSSRPMPEAFLEWSGGAGLGLAITLSGGINRLA